MKSFIAFISESYVFVPNEQNKPGGSTHHYHFKDENDQPYKVTITHNKYTPGRAEVSFSNITNDNKENFTKTNNKGSTAKKVFSTVGDIMRHHAEKHNNLDRYIFSASGSEPSREKLYNAIARKHGGFLANISPNGSKDYKIPIKR